MTVISAIISKECVAIASDSLITQLDKNTFSKPYEYKKPKLVYYHHLKCCASYWGLAFNNNWDTYDWLESLKKEIGRYQTLEAFANYMKTSLEEHLKRMPNSSDPRYGGIGIHLIGYEYIDGAWIPELFFITNYAGTNYNELRPLGLSRETFGTIKKYNPDFVNGISDFTSERVKVQEHLNNNHILIYNNGDPLMFNPAFNTIFGLIKEGQRRNTSKSKNNIEIYRLMVRRPIEIVKTIQKDFYRENQILVGGKIHDFVFDQNGEKKKSIWRF
jgi:hypothetical protein